jgi:crossover junction endodeoxyribonuclease RuvC
MSVIGIDPGGHGALADLDESGQLLDIVDMPTTLEASGRIATNAPLLAAIMARFRARVAFCEFVGARPTDARAAAFSFGRGRGVIEGCAGALRLPLVFLTPPTWKRLANVPPDNENKDLARTRAIARWPQHAEMVARKKDVDRAEAALIASPACCGRAPCLTANERSAELFTFQHENRRWTATIGRFSDGRVAEIFLNAPETISQPVGRGSGPRRGIRPRRCGSSGHGVIFQGAKQ